MNREISKLKHEVRGYRSRLPLLKQKAREADMKASELHEVRLCLDAAKNMSFWARLKFLFTGALP
jgi:hypothetical protein